MRDKPWLLWVWVYFQTPRADGLSDSAEAPVLYAIEDALQEYVEAEFAAIQGGRITTEGRREFYYYGERRDNFELAMQEVMAAFPSYHFVCSTQLDATWNQYLNVLYPSGEDLQKMGNRDVLDALERKGDDPQAQHEVAHWVFFDRGEIREQYYCAAVALGYREVNRYEHDGPQPFILVVARDQKATQDEVDESTIELFRLAASFGGTYDGWETQVMKS